MKKVNSLKLFFILLLTLTGFLYSKNTLFFGAISTVKPDIVKKNFQPLIDYLSKNLNVNIKFATGLNYEDTIEKFINGTFDLGCIGPSPYIFATRKKRDALKLIAGIETNHQPYFYAIIAVRKDSNISKLEDLKGKRFAFGSRHSTLSFYIPFYMLDNAGVVDKLESYDFLGRHDIVAKNIIMGNYDAGGLKKSVVDKYSNYLKKIAVSKPVLDFAIVVHKSLDKNLSKKIKTLLFKLKDKKILNSIKKGVTGFCKRKDSDYDKLRGIMNIVDKKLKK